MIQSFPKLNTSHSHLSVRDITGAIHHSSQEAASLLHTLMLLADDGTLVLRGEREPSDGERSE